jgi:restriction endonuclease S subunit
MTQNGSNGYSAVFSDRILISRGNSMFYAHSENNAGKCETVLEHLNAVSKLCKEFTYEWGEYINANNFRKRVESQSIGATRMRIGLPVLKNLMIPYPPLPEQTAIAQVLSDMNEEIEKLNAKLNKYKNIKQGMMQELLTGKRRFV